MPTSDDTFGNVLEGLAPRPLHQTIFNLADCYNQVAALSFAKIDETENADFAAPAILCCSFAVELLLKFFIVIGHPSIKTFSDLEALGVDLNGHKYSELFDRIDDQFKEAIAARYSRQFGQPTTAAEFRNLFISVGDKPFVDWRYVYESRDTRRFNSAIFNKLISALGLSAQDEVRKLKAKRSGGRNE